MQLDTPGPPLRWKLLEAGIPLLPQDGCAEGGGPLRSGTGCGGHLHRAATSSAALYMDGLQMQVILLTTFSHGTRRSSMNFEAECGPLRGHDQCCWARRQKRGGHEPASPGRPDPGLLYFSSLLLQKWSHLGKLEVSQIKRMPLHTVPTQIQQWLTFCYT